MKKSLVIVPVIAVLALLAGQALAAMSPGAAPKTVTVAMHDPGCHSFLVGGKYLKTLSVKGPVSLVNFDEAALKIVGASGVKFDAVGKKLVLVPGRYRITMVHQAPDDNTLSLTVR